MGSRWFGNAFIYLIIFVAVIAIFFTLFSSGDAAEETDLTTILSMAKTEQISKIAPQSRTTRVTTGAASFEPMALDSTFAHLLLLATVWVSVPSSMRS